MAFLNEKMQQEVKQQLSEMKDDVEFNYFSQQLECKFCGETEQLLKELSGLSEKISLVHYNLQVDKEKASELGIDKVPGLVIKTKDKDYGIKFYGIPSGYEFASLLHAVILVSNGKHDVPVEVEEKLKALKEPVNLQVFVTPTCPYCPSAVANAHKLAYISDNVRAEMIEASEFPELSMKHGVSGVPKTIINGEGGYTGAYPLKEMIGEIEKTLS